ncbi:hypothetical protein SBDP1_70008 [Syntrophobacter sp. SbD1]|nr:hypothetical protein SBDP1_70008 [Syntrophobacter sp. SbD1]
MLSPYHINMFLAMEAVKGPKLDDLRRCQISRQSGVDYQLRDCIKSAFQNATRYKSEGEKSAK